MLHSNEILILGSGSFGTALAIVLAQQNQSVRLWGYDPKEIEAIEKTDRHDQYLPGIEVPRSIQLFTDLNAAVSDIQDFLIAVPSHAFRPLLEKLSGMLLPEARLAWATKGLEPKTGIFLHQVVEQVCPHIKARAVLAGPTFAKEVASGLPTSISVASNSEDFAADLKNRFQSSYFQVVLNDDLIGTQISSVLKNVLAVATGISEGLGFGANAQAALLIEGMQELLTLGKALGGQTETFLGLAGLGDIILTCTDNQSRNRRFGCAIGEGCSFDAAKARIGQVVEAVDNAEELLMLSEKQGVRLPIVEKVNRILKGEIKPKSLFFD